MPCIKPIIVPNSNNTPVPCGRCTQCRKRRASGWSFRLQQEDKISINSHFITLTYATSTVPITDKGFMSLRRKDVSEFIKRLRSAHSRVGKNTRPIRYYAIGEYGGESSRPHYHLIIYNCEINLIGQCWGKGYIHYGNSEQASQKYCLKYISKPSQVPKHSNDDREKEKALISKGIGKNYLSNERGFVQWHKNDLLNRMYVNIGDGKKAAMPRYYKDKLYTEAERELIRKKATENAIDSLSLRVENYGLDRIIDGNTINLENEKQQIQVPYKDKL